jgi:hypothetical protein
MQNVMITLPDGRQISIPQSQLGADVRALITTQGAGQRNAATNASREGIAAENNQTKRDTTTQGIDAREKIAARADATKRELGMAKLALDRSKVAAGPKAPPEIAKAHATLEGSISRLNIMQENKQRALAGDQQAALSMLANHIGMTMGLVPGARINRQIYEEAEMSAPWLQRVEAHFDDQGYLTGVVLTPQQMDQMEDLAVNRLREDRRNLADTENYYGFHGNNAQPTGNTPPRPPGVPPEAQWNGKTWKMPTTNKP